MLVEFWPNDMENTNAIAKKQRFRKERRVVFFIIATDFKIGFWTPLWNISNEIFKKGFQIYLIPTLNPSSFGLNISF